MPILTIIFCCGFKRIQTSLSRLSGFSTKHIKSTGKGGVGELKGKDLRVDLFKTHHMAVNRKIKNKTLKTNAKQAKPPELKDKLQSQCPFTTIVNTFRRKLLEGQMPETKLASECVENRLRNAGIYAF